MVVDSFFRKTNNTTNRLIRSRMKPRQVGKHVVGTFKVQIQQFLQCALTMEVADERRRAETLSTLVNNSSEAMGSTQMRASERARERRTSLFWSADVDLRDTTAIAAASSGRRGSAQENGWRRGTARGTQAPRRRRSSDYGDVISGCNMFVLEKKYW